MDENKKRGEKRKFSCAVRFGHPGWISAHHCVKCDSTYIAEKTQKKKEELEKKKKKQKKHPKNSNRLDIIQTTGNHSLFIVSLTHLPSHAFLIYLYNYSMLLITTLLVCGSNGSCNHFFLLLLPRCPIKK
jgi:hypothetical protein